MHFLRNFSARQCRHVKIFLCSLFRNIASSNNALIAAKKKCSVELLKFSAKPFCGGFDIHFSLRIIWGLRAPVIILSLVFARNEISS